MSISYVISLAAECLTGSVDASHAEQCRYAVSAYRQAVRNLSFSAEDRDAIARITVAEAANQGDSGFTGVIHTIINRLLDGRFGGTVTDIIDAPRQFEPAHKAGGWRNLPKADASQTARVNTIINLALAGHVLDPSRGALYFQNPEVVAAREKQGRVSRGLTHFGGKTPSAVIGEHAFYTDTGAAFRPAAEKKKQHPPEPWDVYGTHAARDVFARK